MTKRHFLLKDVARLLKVKPYQIAYALSVGLVPEPELRISNKRVFSPEDIERLAKHFGVDPGGKAGRKADDAG
jgi:DNA-binding transcriptional MerR regulator